ncbi:LysR substrate-binding domain-containing protein [Thiomonas sp. FB-6]|uniref:LysR substrate-binding domain-containing protein n=1 Tax=Thiomonas sp. FB-6 TaxID=1158291 RepID=UPI001E29FFBA|nr:LysR substrate-binding domain-containing protein [Thiomonas sp. FB-6]
MHDESPSPKPAPGRQRPRPARRIDTGFLRAFEAAARLGGFTAAARDLSLTQSALSRQIQSIEREVGVALFERDGPRVRLTTAGERLAAALRPALASVDATVEQLRQSSQRPRVRITTFASFASLWLMPRLPLFQAEYPEVDIAVEASDQIMDLEATGQDVALRLARPGHVAVRTELAQALFEERIAPVCSPRLLADMQRRGTALRTPADLARTTLIGEVGPGGSSAASLAYLDDLSWEAWFRRVGHREVVPLSWLHLNFTHQTVQAAQAGMGVAMGQLGLIRPLLADGSLVLPLGEPQPAGVFYYMVLREQARERPEVGALVDWLRAQLVQERVPRA